MIIFDDITVQYGDFVALPSFSLAVREGEFFTLLGPSGCGKTTALRTLAGLVEPATGTVTVAGRDVTKLGPDKRELGMVFQNYALFPSMTVEENISFGLRSARVSRTEIQRRVAEIAGEVELSKEQLGRKVTELSGGQQQRVAIARSLVLRPRILLLDEPLSNLDAKLRQQLRKQLKSLQEHFGITTVYVTHDQEEALTMSDRIAVMNAGRIEQVGTPREIYSQSATEFVCTFIGEANRLEPALLQRLHPDKSVRPNDPVYVRLERPTIVGAGTKRNYTVPGTIASVAFSGTTVTYTVDCGDLGALRVLHRADDATYRRDERVQVQVIPESMLRYAEQSGNLLSEVTR